jgi:predicted nucleic acid-binding protein
MTATEPPAPPPAILYVDTSALLKLLVREAESTAIERELLTWKELADQRHRRGRAATRSGARP